MEITTLFDFLVLRWLKVMYLYSMVLFFQWLIKGSVTPHYALKYFICMSLGTIAHTLYEWHHQDNEYI